MDDKIIKTPLLDSSLSAQVQKAEKKYYQSFNGEVWFGRCIFLSWYCKRGTCDFCFRSTQKHKIRHPKTARRRISSVLAEAVLIRGLGWNLEFLTGGYGIYPFKEIVKISKLCSQALGEKLWINLGTLKEYQLKQLRPHVQGIVSSLETLEPKLHDKVCPDKPIQPYMDMIEKAKEMGFKQSFTLVIGIGEKKKDFNYAKDLIKKYGFERITLYALRPVSATPYKKGPKPEDVVWWISKIRNSFPKIEIIAGTAIYRIPEISLFLKAGANAFTKLPATKMFNTKEAFNVEKEVKKSKRKFTSYFTSKDVYNIADWDAIIESIDISKDEKKDVKKHLLMYLDNMDKNIKNNIS